MKMAKTGKKFFQNFAEIVYQNKIELRDLRLLNLRYWNSILLTASFRLRDFLALSDIFENVMTLAPAFNSMHSILFFLL